MKKSLIIVLLTIVGSIKCASMAQEVNEGSKQKIIDYINCFYTAKYILSDSVIRKEEKQIIKEKGIDTVSIGYACRHAVLDSILKSNNFVKTAENLTKELNARNSKLTDADNIFDFVDKVVDTRGFENFKFARKDECDVRNAILKWYFSQNDKSISQEKDKSENKDEAQLAKENKELPNWGWIPLIIIFLYILMKVIMAIKGGGYNDDEEPRSHNSSYYQNSKNEVLRSENDRLKAENIKLGRELREKRDKREEETVIKAQNETVNVVRSESGAYQDVVKTATSTVDIVYYADIDVSNNVFVRTYKEETRISVYAINVNRQTFVPIENKQLYEKLYMVNSSGILGACEVRNNYQKGKSISITPGKVQQEENGKWRIINKAIIEIK